MVLVCSLASVEVWISHLAFADEDGHGGCSIFSDA